MFKSYQGLNNRGFGNIHNIVLRALSDSGLSTYVDAYSVEQTLIQICSEKMFNILTKSCYHNLLISKEL